MINTLRAFHAKLCLKMNPLKSVAYFSKNTDPKISSLISSRMSIPSNSDLGLYLEFFFNDKRPSKNQLSHIARKVQSRLTSWKSKFLSRAGRTNTLISSTVNDLLLAYSMNCISLPKSIKKTIDFIVRNFY